MRSLRIAHIADTHLGYKSNSLSNRDEDFMASWFFACRAIVDSSPDIIIHAGDVFHNARPEWKALTGYTDGIKILLEANCPLFIIAGNHDTTSIHLNHTVFSFTSGIIPQVVATNDLLPSLHNLPELETDVVLVPHKALLDRHLNAKITDLVATMVPGRRRILVSHGSIVKDDPTSEMGSVAIPHEITEHDWDYIALGHLHLSQPYGKKGWYSGSTERCGWSDYPANPAWTLVHLKSNGILEHEQQFVPHMQMFQLPEMDCTGQADDDVINEVVDSASYIEFPSVRANLRVRLTNLHFSRRRQVVSAIQRMLKKDHPELVVNIVLDADKQILNTHEYSSPIEQMKGIKEYFLDFMEEMPYEPEFKESFRKEGMAALEKVTENE